MGAVPSTPRWGSRSSFAARPLDTAEYLITTFIGDKSFPISSDFWNKLLEFPLNLQWQPDRVHQACQTLAQNNHHTRHLAKILIHMAWCLQESISTSSSAPCLVYMKAVNAMYISSIFLKYFIENAKDEKIEELHLSLDESEPTPTDISEDLNIQEFVMHSVLSFIGSIDVSPDTYLLHLELLNFMLVAMSTQLLSGPSPGPEDVNPFIDAAMSQESSLVLSVVRRRLLSYITGPSISLNTSSYSVYSEGSQPGVLQRVGSAAANFMLLPFKILVSSSGEGSRSLLADSSLHVLLILIHYRKCVVGNEPITDKSNDTTASDSLLKGSTHFSDNPYCKVLEHATDVEFDRADTEGNAHIGPVLRLPFATLFDAFGMYNKLAEMRDKQMRLAKGNPFEGNGLADDTVVYAIMHRQEVFQPFRNHPRFSELLENIYTVLDFFNSRMDAQRMDGEWSVEKVLQVIIMNCRSWRGEGMKVKKEKK
ncbi:hypothetical protein C1H46_044444 [Malus baccata]|uniref:Dymeclin n=1 Tax=Malus baccata TaxID=106549 RepID=A0A540K728_MALBA|nr:hypothetical protein C1H46_044444 [Malus baccata]